MKTATFDENLWRLVPVEPTRQMIDAAKTDENGKERPTYWSMYSSMLAAAPEAPAQGEFVHDPACKMCGGRGYYVAGYSGREDDGNAPIHEECDCWIPNPQAPAQPLVPAPWREAMKVAREALESSEAFLLSAGFQSSGAYAKTCAALAQLDALEGGE